MEDDSVIYEFDLNLLPNKCDLFTFTTNDYPFDQDEERKILESIKVKPNAKQFEIKLQFNETETLCKKKNNELRKRIKDNKLMNYKILKSNYLPDTGIKYSICYLNKTKKQLNLMPIEKIYEFQTDFSFIDNQNEINNKTNQLSTKSDLKDYSSFNSSSNDDPLLSPQPIELQNFTLRYENTFDYSTWSHVNYCKLKEKADQEKWQELKLIKKDIKDLNKKNDFNLNDKLNNIDIKSNKSDYNKYCLLPKELIDKHMNDDQHDTIDYLSLSKINKLQLTDKINKLLINCKVIPFFKLINLLDSNLDEELIIKILQKSANLVQGVWVCKSEICYPSNSIESLIHDFISFSFTKSTQLKRDDLNSQIKFPPDILLDILKKLAEFDNKTRSWNFIYPTDNEFLNKYDHIKQQQSLLWEIKIKNLNMQIDKLKEKQTKRKQPLIKKIDEEKIVKKRLRKRKI